MNTTRVLSYKSILRHMAGLGLPLVTVSSVQSTLSNPDLVNDATDNACIDYVLSSKPEGQIIPMLALSLGLGVNLSQAEGEISFDTTHTDDVYHKAILNALDTDIALDNVDTKENRILSIIYFLKAMELRGLKVATDTYADTDAFLEYTGYPQYPDSITFEFDTDRLLGTMLPMLCSWNEVVLKRLITALNMSGEDQVIFYAMEDMQEDAVMYHTSSDDLILKIVNWANQNIPVILS